MKIGYHASHEQFPPSELLKLAVRANAAGFDGGMCSDHFQPWSEAQGQSGFAWSWLGAVLQAAAGRFGVVTCPGYRYHPAIIAQAIATLSQMFPSRFWAALGTGERLNEGVFSAEWPEKKERRRHLLECADAMRRLLAGETVDHQSGFRLIEARLFTRPAAAPLLLGAAISAETAEWVGGWADGLITVSAPAEQVQRVVEAFRRGGGAGKPMLMQVGLNWAPDPAQAAADAHRQWRCCVLGSEINAELATPRQFEIATRHITPQMMRSALLISSDLEWHVERLAEFLQLGFSELHLHQIGSNQMEFIDAFAEHVLPRLRAAEARAGGSA